MCARQLVKKWLRGICGTWLRIYVYYLSPSWIFQAVGATESRINEPLLGCDFAYWMYFSVYCRLASKLWQRVFSAKHRRDNYIRHWRKATLLALASLNTGMHSLYDNFWWHVYHYLGSGCQWSQQHACWQITDFVLVHFCIAIGPFLLSLRMWSSPL